VSNREDTLGVSDQEPMLKSSREDALVVSDQEPMQHNTDTYRMLRSAAQHEHSHNVFPYGCVD
jgi:hypothetical protein